MKKFWKSLMFALVGVFALSSCEDVPAPYTIPGTESGNGSKAELASVDFTQGQGNWVFIEDPSLAGVWKNNQYGMVASGFKNSKACAATSWMVSPEIDLTATKGAKAVIDEAVNKIDGGSVEEMMTVWVSTDDGTTWEPLTANKRPAGTSWTFQKDEFDLSAYDGKIIKLGFKYISTDQYAGTWEIKSIAINGEGTATIDGQSTQPEPTPVGDPEGEGTAESPYNIAAALKICSELEKSSTSASYLSDEVYVKGKVSKIDALKDGTLTYFISEDGSSSNELEIYKGKYLNGNDFFSQDLIKVGNEVVVFGKLQNWLGTYEFTAGSKLISIDGNTTPEEPQPITGDNLLENGDFEAWTEGLPDNWKSASTAGNATLSQSEDAHDGSYAVAIAAATSNKRMAYKELTLKAGTYTFSFYAKSTTEDKSQCRPGYVIVNDGVADKNYKYGSYVTLNNTEWTEGKTTFTLNAQTTICLVIMNPTSSDYAVAQTILVDDATLITADGGIADGDDSGNGNGDGDTPAEGTAYTLATSVENGTYLIAANTGDNNYQLATDLGTRTYGYLSGSSATATENVITTNAATAEWTITAVEGGYTIQDSTGRYLFMKGTFDSFNVDASQQESYIWDITIAEDGTATIKNVEKQKTIQWSTQFNSYGSYSTSKGILPKLFKK